MNYILMISERQRFIESFKSPLFHLAIYFIGFSLYWVSNMISPTNLAGPGLDLLVLFLWLLSIVVSITIQFFLKQIPIIQRIAIIVVHLAGISALIWLLNQPTAVGGHIKL
jgi:hypothetical protein